MLYRSLPTPVRDECTVAIFHGEPGALPAGRTTTAVLMVVLPFPLHAKVHHATSPCRSMLSTLSTSPRGPCSPRASTKRSRPHHMLAGRTVEKSAVAQSVESPLRKPANSLSTMKIPSASAASASSGSISSAAGEGAGGGMVSAGAGAGVASTGAALGGLLAAISAASARSCSAPKDRPTCPGAWSSVRITELASVRAMAGLHGPAGNQGSSYSPLGMSDEFSPVLFGSLWSNMSYHKLWSRFRFAFLICAACSG